MKRKTKKKKIISCIFDDFVDEMFIKREVSDQSVKLRHIVIDISLLFQILYIHSLYHSRDNLEYVNKKLSQSDL